MFSDSPTQSIPLFKSSIRAMLSYNRYFNPPIIVGDWAINLSAGSISGFSDRTVLASVNFTDATTAARVAAQLAVPNNLMILYLGYRFYAAALAAPVVMLRPVNEQDKDVSVFLVSTFALVLVFALFYRYQSRLKMKRRAKDDREALL